MLNFMGWLWSLFLLFPAAYSHVPGICISEEVTSLNISQGRDAVFRLDQNIGNDAQRIMWFFITQQLILAITSAGESSPDWIINSTQYEGRLSLLPDKSLMLSNLTTEDSGCYEAEVKSSLGGITTQKFNLTVLDADNTEPNMNPENHSHHFAYVSLGVCVFLLISYLCYPRLRGIHRRGIPHTEENGPQEENEHSQMTFL